jgi:hypothetical protein
MPYIDTATRSIDVDGTAFAYRDLGLRSGVPLVLLNHWGAVLDNFDPRIVDGLSRRHRIIAIDYRGIGASGGTAPVTIDAMARDAVALIHAMGFEKIDLRASHSRLATGHLQRRRAWRDLPVPRRVRAQGAGLPQRLNGGIFGDRLQ